MVGQLFQAAEKASSNKSRKFGKRRASMAKIILYSRIRRRSTGSSAPHTPMVRQWQLLEWLSSEPEGVTVAEAAIATGMDQKTIRRDLILLRKIGFDLDETVEERGRKRWRIRQSFERLRSKKRRYQAIRDSLDLLLEQVDRVGDRRLVDDLKAMRQRVVRKCRTV